MMIWSKYQNDIFDAVLNTAYNININASAGSAKTTTIVEAATRYSKKFPYKSILFNAFNNSIVEELKKRLPDSITCSTIHSLGMQSLIKHYKTSMKVNDYKSFVFADKVIEGMRFKRNQKDVYKYTLMEIVNLMRMTLVDVEESAIEELCNRFDITITNGEIDDSIKLLNHLNQYNEKLSKSQNYIDFTDMVYIPAIEENIWLKQYDIIFTDEAQDCNKVQQLFIEKSLKKNGRLISVGDKHQCQPMGTKILMIDRTEKNIEDLCIGDKVVSYVFGHNYFCGRLSKAFNARKSEVQNIQKRYYNGNLICIYSGNKISKYTPNHKCIVTFNKEIKFRYCLYLMQKGNFFRIGLCPIFNNKKIVRIISRFQTEFCDKGWILKLYETRAEAWYDEQFYSAKYGIPQMVFKNRNYLNKTQKILDNFFERFNTKQQLERSKSLLSFFNKDIEYPFFNRDDKFYFSSTRRNIVYACNLFPELMSVIHFEEYRNHRGDRQGKKIPIKKIKIEKYSDFVYSLKINSTETYVADNIATHNSIYGFAGSDVNSFDYFKNRPNTISLPLTVCYRCAKSIVRNAQEVNSEIEVYEKQEEGVVRKGTVEEITKNDLVICRNTRPLVALYFQLLESDKKSYIKGRDVENGLIALYNKVKDLDKHEAKIELTRRLEFIEDELAKKKVKKPREHVKYINFREKVRIIEIISNKVQYMFEVEKLIHELFKDRVDAIKLMTIHKSKGLENDRVFIIDSFNGEKLIPSKYATQPWELEQENNLYFVACTRAKAELIYLNYIE